MSKALVRQGGNGVLPAVCSALIRGVGQLVNGETDKAIGVGVTAVVTGWTYWHHIPVLGVVAGLAFGATWLYGVADGYIQGRKK
jgi:TM2 domain-containing membrane protein YozV